MISLQRLKNRNYILVEYSEVTNAMITDCIQDSRATLQHYRLKNNPIDYVVLKWHGDIPASFAGLNTQKVRKAAKWESFRNWLQKKCVSSTMI